MLKLTLGQINPTIGDIGGNVALMRNAGVGKAEGTTPASSITFPASRRAEMEISR